MDKLIMTLALFVLIFGCNNSTKPGSNVIVPNDTTKSFRIGDYWLTPKPVFKFNSIGNAKGDTLDLVTCSDYVYFPFGKIKNKSELKTSLLNNFNIVDRKDTLVNGVFEFQILNLSSNKMILFFDNDPDAVISSYIFKGEINDKNARFVNGVTIGMNKKDFITKFFDSFPDELIDKFDVIVLETCVTGTNHFYTFNNNTLKSIRFDCIECTWDLDYEKK